MENLYTHYKRLRDFNTPSGALEKARAMIAQGEDWYAIRTRKHTEYNSPIGKPKGGTHVRWVENVSNALRIAGFTDELTEVRHKGWYCDAFREEIYRGIVYRLPHGRFAYGYADPHNEDCALLCFDNDASDEKEAARMADDFARVYAEEAREYDEAYQEGAKYAELLDEAKQAKTQARGLVTALRAERGRAAPPAICDALHNQLRAYLAEMHEARQKARRVLDGVYTWQKDAFNEGAGFTAIA